MTIGGGEKGEKSENEVILHKINGVCSKKHALFQAEPKVGNSREKKAEHRCRENPDEERAMHTQFHSILKTNEC